MAHHHPQSSLSIFTQKFEDELECQVCLTEYVNPKVLPCHHAFCLKCIQHIPTVEKSNRYTISCPTCRAEHEAPENGGANLKSAFHIIRLQDLQKALPKKTSSSMSCTEHNDPLKVFCETCQKVICQDCTFTKQHKAHTFELIKECYPRHRQEIETNLKLVRKKLANNKTAVLGLTYRVMEIDIQGEEVKNEIHTCAQQLIQWIQGSENQLIEEVDAVMKKKKESVSKQMEEARRINSHYKSCENKIETNLKEESQPKFLMNKQAMMSDMSKISKFHLPLVFQPIEEANIRFSKSGTDITNGIGNIKSSRYEKCVIKSSLCYLNEPSTVFISLQSQDGSPFTLPQSLISFRVISPDSDQSLPQCTIAKTGSEGEYKISFTPRGRSNHQLTIKVGGTMTSTHQLDIKEQVQTTRNYLSAEMSTRRPDTHMPRSVGATVGQNYTTGNLQQPVAVPRRGGSLAGQNYTTGNLQPLRTKRAQVMKMKLRNEESANVRGSLLRHSRPRKLLRTIHLDNGHKHFAILENGDILAVGRDDVTKLDRDGTLRSIKANTDSFKGPWGIAMYDQAHFLVTDRHRLQLMSIYGELLSSIGTSICGRSASQFNQPAGIAVHPTKAQVYVADYFNNRIQIFSINVCKAQPLTYYGSIYLHDGQQMYPTDVAVDRDGYLFVADCDYNCITKFTPSGKYAGTLGSYGSSPGQLHEPISLAVSNNLVYVCEQGNNRVSIFDTDGKFINCFSETGRGEGQFDYLVCIRILQNELYVNDRGNRRIQVFDKL